MSISLPKSAKNWRTRLTPKKLPCNPLRVFHVGLKRFFNTLGQTVANYPSYFILFPIFFTILALTGIQKFRQEDNPEILFYPVTGSALKDRHKIEVNFPLNFTDSFLPYHMTRPSGFSRVLVTPIDGGSIFKEDIWNDVVRLDDLIRTKKSEFKGKAFNYSDLCATYNGECYKNRALDLLPFIPEIENGSMHVNYPIMLYPLILPFDFGGLDIDDEEGIIKSARALSLGYFLKQNTEDEIEKSLIWEQSFLEEMKDLRLTTIDVAYFAGRSKRDEMISNTDSIKPYTAITGVVLTIFSVCSVLTTDWVRGKVYIAFLGLASAGMATMTAFGTLMYIGVPFISINRIIPFLMMGIGIDDMFVVLASWRRTRIQDPVMKRMSETYADAGVSVTITSLTNILSFSVGIWTPIVGVQIFCIYTTICVFLTYLWHLSFFGGCLAVAGYLEGQQKHSITCFKIKAKSESGKVGRCYKMWCTGGVSSTDPFNEEDNRPHPVTKAFRDILGSALNISVVKALVLLIFATYAGGAIYGCTTLKEGLDRKHVIRYDSYAVNFYNTEDRYFRKYPYVLQILLTGNITYSDPSTEEEIQLLHKNFEKLPFSAESLFTHSWVRSFYHFLKEDQEAKSRITDEKSFIKVLREQFFSGGSNPLALDVKFNDDYTKIEASRFVIHTHDIQDSLAEVAMVAAFRDVANNSPLNVTVFNPNFVLFDQLTMVKPITIEAIGIAVVAMILVSLIFIPNPWCSLLVGLAIISIETGVVGYMALWGVHLDQISMINLIMCIGFSVDFSAHISYAYLTAEVRSIEDKMKECLYSLGLPILQGGLSTLVCICTFIFVPSYVYVTFFKIVFLVVFFATMHGLLLIPVLLSLFGPGSKSISLKSEIRIPRVKIDHINNMYTMDEVSSKSASPSSLASKSSKKSKIRRTDFANQSRPDPEGSSNQSFVADCSYKERIR